MFHSIMSYEILLLGGSVHRKEILNYTKGNNMKRNDSCRCLFKQFEKPSIGQKCPFYRNCYVGNNNFLILFLKVLVHTYKNFGKDVTCANGIRNLLKYYIKSLLLLIKLGVIFNFFKLNYILKKKSRNNLPGKKMKNSTQL